MPNVDAESAWITWLRDSAWLTVITAGQIEAGSVGHDLKTTALISLAATFLTFRKSRMQSAVSDSAGENGAKPGKASSASIHYMCGHIKPFAERSIESCDGKEEVA